MAEAEKYLIVVDMQNDFITGSLGTKEAEAIVSRVTKKVQNFVGTIIFTRDTHEADYLLTQEGKNLPVEHCIRGTEGWEITPELDKVRIKRNSRVYDKPTFGSTALAEDLRNRAENQQLISIELAGLCTDICVVSNALLVKAYLPEIPVIVDASCCAGVTPEKHEAALETLRSCQVSVI